jgi:hypothetical protein
MAKPAVILSPEENHAPAKKEQTFRHAENKKERGLREEGERGGRRRERGDCSPIAMTALMWPG